jgi:alpha-beta hydrolase superfamily lysophospholipase
MRSFVRLLAAVLLGAGGPVAAAAAPAGAAVDLPGYVLSSSAASLPGELASLATGKRVQYLSTDVRGTLVPTTGLVLTPRTGKVRKVVVWAHGTTGLADQCAPSANEAVFWSEARLAVAELLRRGWTVAAPDYPGLGTALPHPYLVGLSEARSIIDSVKAARNLDSSLLTAYAIDGHSQGGQGGLFANQIAPSYDGNLVLKGTAAIAPASNVDVLAPDIPGTPGQGYLVMGLYGLNAVEPTFLPATVLAAPARAKTPVLQTGCLNEILAAYANLTRTELLTGGNLPASWVNKLKQYDNPGQSAPTAPILVVQGLDDQAVPAPVTEIFLIPQLSNWPGAQVEYRPIANADHDQAVVQTTGSVADWIAARL